MKETQKRIAFYTIAAVTATALIAWLLHTWLVFVPVDVDRATSCEIHDCQLRRCIARNTKPHLLGPGGLAYFSIRCKRFPYTKRPGPGRWSNAPQRYPFTHWHFCRACVNAETLWNDEAQKVNEASGLR